MDEYKNNATRDEFSDPEDNAEIMDDADDFEVNVQSEISSERFKDLGGDIVEGVEDEVERLCEQVLSELDEDLRDTEAEVLGMEDELEELRAQKSSLKNEVRGHKKEVSHLNSKLRKQKRMLGNIDRQQGLQEMIENYELGPNEIFMDVDELEYLDACSGSESEERIKKLEKKAKKAEARRGALEKTLRELEDTEAAIAQADIVAEDAETDIVLMGLHAENMQKIIEDASVGRIRAHQHLDEIQKSVRHFRDHCGQSLIRPHPRLARLLYKLDMRSGAVVSLSTVAPAMAAQTATKTMPVSANATSGPEEDPAENDASGMCSNSVAQRFKSFIESRKNANAYGTGRR